MVIGFNAREGLTLHDIRYSDRKILFRASLTEMVVPYGDPSATQARKNAFDVGEYGVGMFVMVYFLIMIIIIIIIYY